MPLIRVNFNAYEDGEQYRFRLTEEANRNLRVFLNLLSSYWRSTIDGPNYVRELKAVSLEMARVRLALDDIWNDTYYRSTRGEFLYQVLTSMLFPDGKAAPNFNSGDVEFREFLTELVKIYFKGSIPESIQEAVELVVNGQVIVTENFKEARKPGSSFDISDQFGFNVDVLLDNPSDVDVFLADKNIRILLNIIRPAHTLFRLSFILQDEYTGQQDPDPDVNKPYKVVDAFTWILENYGYEDHRRFWDGIDGIDYLGMKKSVAIVGEDHSDQF